MLDAVTIAFLAVLVSSLSLIATIFLHFWGKKWEHNLVYRMEYIKRTFQETLTRIKEYDDGVNKYLNGESDRMDSYAYIKNIKRDGGFGIIKKIDQELYTSMNVVHEKLNPNIIKLMALRENLNRKIVDEWAAILKSKGIHKGIDEKSLAGDFYHEYSNIIFMGNLNIIDEKKFNEAMEKRFKGIIDYLKNPYPPETIEEFKETVKKHYPEYKKLLDEIKTLKEKHIDKIIIPKMEKKIEDPL